MNLLTIIFTFLVYGLFIAMYNGDAAGTSTFPIFTPPNITFEELPDGCGGFSDCIEYVGKMLTNFVLGVVYLVLLTIEIIRVLVALIVTVTTNAFTGIDTAPGWVNSLITGIFSAAIIIIVYKAVRKGDTDA